MNALKATPKLKMSFEYQFLQARLMNPSSTNSSASAIVAEMSYYK